MKNKIISILLSVTVLISVFSVFDAGIFTVNALDLLKKSDYEYVVDSCNNVTITSYKGCDRKVTIPSEIDGMPVVEIGDYCFNGDSRRASATDDSLKKHPNRFFNRRVKRIVIPSTVRTIGENAFGNMDRLEEVVFSEGLTTIEEYAFSFCTSLKSFFFLYFFFSSNSLTPFVLFFPNFSFLYCYKWICSHMRFALIPAMQNCPFTSR